MPPDPTTQLDLDPQVTVRVYADISAESEMKLRLRCIQMQREDGRKYTRKEYLEKLIEEDVAKVSGASLREVKARRNPR